MHVWRNIDVTNVTIEKENFISLYFWNTCLNFNIEINIESSKYKIHN